MTCFYFSLLTARSSTSKSGFYAVTSISPAKVTTQQNRIKTKTFHFLRRSFQYLIENMKISFVRILADDARLFQQEVWNLPAVGLSSPAELDLEVLSLQRQHVHVCVNKRPSPWKIIAPPRNQSLFFARAIRTLFHTRNYSEMSIGLDWIRTLTNLVGFRSGG